jgi:hypothetical protein
MLNWSGPGLAGAGPGLLRLGEGWLGPIGGSWAGAGRQLSRDWAAAELGLDGSRAGGWLGLGRVWLRPGRGWLGFGGGCAEAGLGLAGTRRMLAGTWRDFGLGLGGFCLDWTGVGLAWGVGWLGLSGG